MAFQTLTNEMDDPSAAARFAPSKGAKACLIAYNAFNLIMAIIILVSAYEDDAPFKTWAILLTVSVALIGFSGFIAIFGWSVRVAVDDQGISYESLFGLSFIPAAGVVSAIIIQGKNAVLFVKGQGVKIRLTAFSFSTAELKAIQEAIRRSAAKAGNPIQTSIPVNMNHAITAIVLGPIMMFVVLFSLLGYGIYTKHSHHSTVPLPPPRSYDKAFELKSP